MVRGGELSCANRFLGVEMKTRFAGAVLVAAAVVAVVIVAGGVIPVSGQGQPFRPARTADGKPTLTGICQAMSPANWDIQAHEARPGPVVSLGAAFSVPGGPGVVEGDEIPVRPPQA